MAGSMKKKPGMGMDKGMGSELPGKKKKRKVKPAKVKKAY